MFWCHICGTTCEQGTAFLAISGCAWLGDTKVALRASVGPIMPFFANPRFVYQSCRDGGICLCIAVDFGPQRMGRIPLPSQRPLSRPGICMAANGEYANNSLWQRTRRRRFMLVGPKPRRRRRADPHLLQFTVINTEVKSCATRTIKSQKNPTSHGRTGVRTATSRTCRRADPSRCFALPDKSEKKEF